MASIASSGDSSGGRENGVVLAAIPDGKPVSTFPGIALVTPGNRMRGVACAGAWRRQRRNGRCGGSRSGRVSARGAEGCGSTPPPPPPSAVPLPRKRGG